MKYSTTPTGNGFIIYNYTYPSSLVHLCNERCLILYIHILCKIIVANAIIIFFLLLVLLELLFAASFALARLEVNKNCVIFFL